MSGGAQQSPYFLSDLVSLPGDISFGFPPTPVERGHWLIKITATHVGGNIEAWGMQEWELATRYLARALETSLRREIQRAQPRPDIFKRGRGRPRKIRLNTLLALMSKDSGPKRKRGRPSISDEDWLNIYSTVNSYREELMRKSGNTRITDKAAITFAAERVAKYRHLSNAWVRKVVPVIQKRFSESKKRVRKMQENS